MEIFSHHVYEYKRGLRNLILLTINRSFQEYIKERLQKENIAYIIKQVNGEKINVFFGHPSCIDVLKRFPDVTLNNLTDEHDFILGIMLGYDRLKQCERYIQRKKRDTTVEELIG